MSRSSRVGALLAAVVLAVAVAAGVAFLTSVPPTGTIAWTQFGYGDRPELIARALLGKDGDCPAIEFDGVAGRMVRRDDPRAAAFGAMCEARRPLGEAMDVRIREGRTVLLDQHVTRQPSRVLLFGDTGCRVTSFFDQVCGDPKKWGFAAVATAAASQAPDLILHLGDYYYREAPCKGSSAPCEVGPYGDREETWRADFFAPVGALLAKAPWVFGRGNHEDCLRGGYGWFYYFGEGPAGCELVHRPAQIAFKGWSLVSFDSAHTDDRYAVDPVNKGWLALADTLGARKANGEPILLLTHEPGYFVCIDDKTRQPVPCREEGVVAVGGVRAIAEAARSTGARTILLSGHIHSFQVLDTPTLTQVIVGTGGTAGDQMAQAFVPPAIGDFALKDRRLALTDGRWRPTAGGPTVSGKVQGWSGFGFGLLAPATMDLAMYDDTGKRLFSCALAGEAKVPRCR